MLNNQEAKEIIRETVKKSIVDFAPWPHAHPVSTMVYPCIGSIGAGLNFNRFSNVHLNV